MITQDVLHTLAAIGVPQRIQAIEQELTAYYQEWPHLFHAAPTIAGLANGNGHGIAPVSPPNGNHAAPPATAPIKRRRKMSRKARAAISVAQKARWAKQKRAKHG